MPFAVIDNMSLDRRTLTGYIPRGLDREGLVHHNLSWTARHPDFVSADADLLWNDGSVSAVKPRGLPVRRGFALTFSRPLALDEIDAGLLGVQVDGRRRDTGDPGSLTLGNPVVVDRTFVHRAIEQERTANADDALFARTFSTEAAAEVRAARTSPVAVLVHCYYGDVLGTVLEHLRLLDGVVDHDLFVDVPQERLGELDELRRLRPDARVLVVPNRGRDILPFLRAAPFLQDCGYEVALKLHTKKSPTSTIGPRWLASTLRALVPEDPALLRQVVETLRDPGTAIIGPERYYYPLSFGFSASDNLRNLITLVGELTGRVGLDDVVDGFYTDFGFFAGTMFWTRLDAFECVYGIETARIEPEPLPTDATFAHSLERLFGAIPAVLGRTMYSVSVDGRPEPLALREPGTRSPMRPLG